MAKQKKPDDDTLAGAAGDGIERADGGDGDGAPLAEDERDELERLRAENAALRGKPGLVEAPAAAGPARKWLGTHPHSVPIVVLAADEVHAEREYLKAAGILRSDHAPTLVPAPDDAELGPASK